LGSATAFGASWPLSSLAEFDELHEEDVVEEKSTEENENEANNLRIRDQISSLVLKILCSKGSFSGVACIQMLIDYNLRLISTLPPHLKPMKPPPSDAPHHNPNNCH
jgi:hypothetical protein